MTGLRFIQVDAFADRPFTGNPAAVVPLDAEWLPDDAMQAIAEENNLSETAFTIPATGEADYELRWFTPTTEVALCGHATLASGHVLIAGDRVRFRTRRAGVLTVSRSGADLLLDLPVTRVRPGAWPGLADAMGTDRGALHLSHEGAEATAILELPDAAAVAALAPDMKALRDIELMVIATARGGADPPGGADVVSRVFVPAWGVDEDPVTGSAHAALAPFWCERLGTDRFTAWQASRRGGRVACRLDGDRALLGGRCVTVIEGMLRL